MRFLATEKLSSHKYKTPEGYLVCVDAVLSRTGKQEYYRSELFGDSCEDADKKIAVDRLESDVFDEKALASFENKPVCIEHPNEDVNVANHNEWSVGFVRDIKRGKDNGQDVMLGTLVITDESAISAIESGEYTELSCGYDCDIRDEETPRQTNIRGNHVALCKHGRAGNARIVDSTKDGLASADYRSTTVSQEDSIKTNDGGIKVWQVHQGYAIVAEKYWRQYGKNAFVDAVESNIDAARYHRYSLERNDRMSFIIIDCNDGKYKIEDNKMRDIQATEEESKRLRDDLTEVEEENYEKANDSMKEVDINDDWSRGVSVVVKVDTNSLIDAAKNRKVRIGSGSVNPEKLIGQTSLRFRLPNGDDTAYLNLGRSESSIYYIMYDNQFTYKEFGGKSDFDKAKLTSGLKDLQHYVESQLRSANIRIYQSKVEVGGSSKFNSTWRQAQSYNDSIKDRWSSVEEEADKKDIKDASQKGIEIRLFGDDYQIAYTDAKGRQTHQRNFVNESTVKQEIAAAKRRGERVVYFVDPDVRKRLGDADYAQSTKQDLHQVAKDETEKLFKIYVKTIFGAYKVVDWPAVSKEAAVKEFLEANPAYRHKGVIEARDSITQDSKERLFTIEYKQDDAIHIHKVRANSIKDAIIKVKDEVSTAHKVVVFTQNILSEMGKNNSIGKYDKVISAMRQIYGQSLLPDDKLKEAIRRELPRILTKYGL